MDNNKAKKVLVTGITGFIGLHVAVQLLNNGYTVRGSMRNLDRQDSILKILKSNCKDLEPDNIEFVKAELTNPEDWDVAMKNIDYVMHIASPLPLDLQKNEDDLIIPAREGTLNVLQAAHQNKVKRTVITSSIAAIGHGHNKSNRTYTEDDWTNLKGKKDISPYIKSKTIAESEAWKFVNQKDVDMELAVINPGYVLGPLLEQDYSDSAEIVRKLMAGDVPGLPRISFPLVDVRDVAEMHLWAMELPEAAGKRFVCVNESSWYKEIAMILHNEFPEYHKKIKTLVLPDFFIRLYGLFDKSVKTIKNELGRYRTYDNTRAVELFNWTPRSNKDAIVSMAESMIRLGVV